jgi:Uma2 family endonuclease
MGPLAEKKGELFTYSDYLTWDDDERWELIDGVAYNMTPAPSRFHQQVYGDLYRQLANFFLNTSCKVYAAPFDVRLPEMDDVDMSTRTIVQPDISVICDPSKLDERGCKGAPDLVVEILSPATARKDMKEKFLRYESEGILDS